MSAFVDHLLRWLWLYALLGAIAYGLGTVSWHFWKGFRRRRHPMSVVAMLLPVGWFVACLLCVPQPGYVRAIVLAAACVMALGGWHIVSMSVLRQQLRDALELKRLRELKKKGDG